MSPLPVSESHRQNIPSTSSYSPQDLYNPLASPFMGHPNTIRPQEPSGSAELDFIPFSSSPRRINHIPSKDLRNPLESPVFNSSQDYPMSPDLHTDPYVTSPHLIHPMLSYPNSAYPLIYPDSEMMTQDLVIPLANPMSPEIDNYSMCQDMSNPLIPQIHLSMSQDLLNPLTGEYNPSLINPLVTYANPISQQFHHFSTSQDLNPLTPQMVQDLSNSLTPRTQTYSSPENLSNPLTPYQISSTPHHISLTSQTHLLSPSSALCNPLTPDSSSVAPNRSPACSDQVAGPPRPVARSSRLPATACHTPQGKGVEIGVAVPLEMSRAGAGVAPPDVPPAPASAPAPTATAETHQPDDPHQLYATLNDYLLLEHKFQPRLCLPQESDKSEVTAGARSGAAHVLRCLAVWFDLPPSVFFTAISLLDRFLTKMRVRPCHVACITVSCMKLALERAEDAPHVTVEELVSVSQSACTAGDVTRMSRVIADKLEVTGESVTALHWLRLLRRIVACAASELGLPPICDESVLVKQLEIAVCDAACANARLSELALVLVFHKIEQQMVEWSSSGLMAENAYYLYELGAQLQQHCRMSDDSLSASRHCVMSALSRYEASARAPHRQRLVWRLSSRTLKVLRPTERLTSVLPTIEEQHNNDASSPRTPNRNRSGSESSENEETSDWPRSPVLPVYCDN